MPRHSKKSHTKLNPAYNAHINTDRYKTSMTNPPMTRIVQFHRAGPPDVLALDTVPLPEPGPGEVRIAVKAIGFNRADSMFREDNYVEGPEHFPARLGYEASGIVDAVGPGVTAPSIGDAVTVVPAFSLNQYGMHGEHVLAPVHALAPLPEGMTFEQGASVWSMFLTAYGALIAHAKVGAGDVVLIDAASSSVGLAAIQIANLAGATPIAITRTAAKRQKLLDNGAAHVIVTGEQDLVAEVLRITDGKGARVAFDAIGGEMVGALLRSLSPGGTLFAYGDLARKPVTIPWIPFVGSAATIRGYMVAEFTTDPEKFKTATAFLLDGFRSKALRPVIDRVFRLDEIVQAHRYLEANGQFGKIVAVV